jgi:hypothetical protein
MVDLCSIKTRGPSMRIPATGLLFLQSLSEWATLELKEKMSFTLVFDVS